jgi:hypothetical protein
MIDPESIQVGHCYLMKTGQVRRVMRVMPDRRVQYEFRPPHQLNAGAWRSGMQSGRSFADLVERPVPCDWTPKTDA